MREAVVLGNKPDITATAELLKKLGRTKKSGGKRSMSSIEDSNRTLITQKNRMNADSF